MGRQIWLPNSGVETASPKGSEGTAIVSTSDQSWVAKFDALLRTGTSFLVPLRGPRTAGNFY